jgi:hypothetical protein
MQFLYQQFVSTLRHSKETGLLQVLYALATEALVIGYLYFLGLFTVETLLPTFVTVRFSLALFLLVLVVLTLLIAALGRFLGLSFPLTITPHHPLFVLALLWGISILVVSLIKFPPLSIPVIILLFLIVGYLFWQLFFEEK